MLTVAFYSYKGGVGRSLALLNLGTRLATAGRHVVAVDFDLEAPGFGDCELLNDLETSQQRGISDFILDRASGQFDLAISEYLVTPSYEFGSTGSLRAMTVGTQTQFLIDSLPSLYKDMAGPSARLFELLAAEMRTLGIDVLLLDSRTGRAPIAGVCLIELADLVVACAALNEQNVCGMKDALEDLRSHPARAEPPAVLFLLGPVPNASSLGVPSLGDELERIREAPESRSDRIQQNPLLARYIAAQTNLVAPAFSEEERNRVALRFPHLLLEWDLFHVVPYNPWVPLLGELVAGQQPDMAAVYDALARTIRRATGEAVSEDPSADPRMWFVEHCEEAPDEAGNV